MEDRLARLQISNGKEEEVLQFRGLSRGMIRLYDCCSVGHSDSFRPIRFRMDVDKMELKWDISLRAQPLMRVVVEESIWLRNS
ncbi:hypothetical protein PVK06_005271 [Gossypium arboreum]|uniref:Uncharacterized protein n=1 Tax=Gossypium arboreum TaxID=29729 RepID=A0ABR0QVF2_GOSAR|nr:hypothetical protein PVK06_005271 [Gossypium arboreum]